MNDPISFQAILKTHVRQQNQPEGNILAFMGVIALLSPTVDRHCGWGDPSGPGQSEY
jgi:hypothetical protein